MIKNQPRRVILFFFVVLLLVAALLFIVARNAIFPNLDLGQVIFFWITIVTLSVLYLFFERFIVYRRFNQVLTQLYEHTAKTKVLLDESNTRLSTLLDQRNTEMATLLDERSSRMVKLINKYSMAQKDYVERRLRNMLEVQLGILPFDTARELQLSDGTEGLLRYAKERHQKYIQEVNFNLLQEKSQIREIYLSELFADIEELWMQLGAINEETGHENHVDLMYVNAIARHRRSRNLFEFGTYMGRTTYYLTYAAEGAVVTTLNLPPEADPRIAPFLGIYFRGTEREQFIRQIYADSREFDTTSYRHKMDFIFVDGDHGYDLVKNDTAKAFEMLAPNGAIVWHDYAAKSPGVVQFFQEFTKDQPVFRIKNTCLLVHLDGVDPLTFTPYPMQASLESEQRDKHSHNYVLYHL